MGGGDLHSVVDVAGPGIEGAPEDAGEGQHIVDLVSDEERSEDYIIPGAFDPRVADAVADAVAKAARETGVARL